MTTQIIGERKKVKFVLGKDEVNKEVEKHVVCKVEFIQLCVDFILCQICL